jgi:Gnt-I system high-affinity gluconate transporter
MTLLIILFCIIVLVILVSWIKLNPFIAFLVVSIAAGLLLGIPLDKVSKSVQSGLGDTFGKISIIICVGAMIGKLVAVSGAAQKIAGVLVNAFGIKHIMLFFLLIPFIF